MQRRKGLTRRTPLRSKPGTRLATRKPLKAKAPLARGSGLKRKSGISKKRGAIAIMREFDPEVVEQMVSEQRGRCLRCDFRLPLDPHHKKPRSALTRRDIELHGRGGGRANCIGLCRRCHEDVTQHLPGTERFRTGFHQEVGEDLSTQ